MTHYNTGTDRLYCTDCARAINFHNPGLCIPYARPEPTASTARVRLSAAKVDIENAFGGWTEYSESDNAYKDVGNKRMSQYRQDIKEAQSRVFAFIAQVEAADKRYLEAIRVCHVLSEATNDKEVSRAKRMAKEVLASYGEPKGY
ncbi:hypothetical protein V5E97_06865 [Singulisphaera sp. Ch08]|uniref:Uncharacterized protein n=1 Tax=Singulisphaera sp. Ch08 TaxID=3120278 RepID=A0AAU7CKG1_9BACT